jgi:sterol desaturase/sphingolipid hydroxylase (fatty acid hydroxylase superfamily)
MDILYHAWIAHWLTYFIFSSMLQSSKTIISSTRSSANMTTSKLYINLLTNICFTALIIPFISRLPILIETVNESILFTILRYMLLLLVSEITLYYGHRLLHFNYFYEWHKDHHAYIKPCAIAALYVSIPEMIMLNPLWIMIIYRLFDYSQLEIIIISILLSMNIVKDHSGINFNDCIHPIFRNKIITFFLDNDYHELHHRYLNVNYGNFQFLDYLHNTLRHPC